MRNVGLTMRGGYLGKEGTGLDERFYQEFWAHFGGTQDEREKNRAELLVGMVPAGVHSVLEVGCGDGLIINRVNVESTMGLDVDVGALKGVIGPSVVASASEIPFDDRSWDVVIVSEVLEHFPPGEYERSLKEIARVARSSIVVSVPNSERLSSCFARCAKCSEIYHRYCHYRSFKPRDMSGLFTGFVLETHQEIGPPYRVGWKLENFLRNRILGEWSPCANTICPSCGFSYFNEDGASADSALRGNGFISLVSRTLNVAARMTGNIKPKWIAARYSRGNYPRTTGKREVWW